MNDQQAPMYTIGKDACDEMIAKCQEQIDFLEFALNSSLESELKNSLSVCLLSEAYSANYNLLSILQWKKFETLPNSKELVTTLNQVEALLVSTTIKVKSTVSSELAMRMGISLEKH